MATFVKGSDAGINTEVIVDWLSATTDEVCEKGYNAYAPELKSLEEQCDRMGRRTGQSQWGLVSGSR